MKKAPIIASLIIMFAVGVSFMATASQLSRSTLLGIMPEHSSEGQHVVLQQVVSNSTASTLGLKAGDKILKINNNKISDFSALLAVVRPLKAQQAISITFERNGKNITKSGVMQPRPYELSKHAKVIYDSVQYDENQLRSIIYKPSVLKANEKAPAIFFIQGYTCGSIDMGMMPQATTKQLVEQFAEAGYVVFRVEKPGVGDSQSTKHCTEIDFTEESLAFTEALKSLKKKAYVNEKQVYLWGHSLGVLHAAVVANKEPVAGVIGYGGVLKPWYDYMLDIYQHQSVKHFGTAKSQAEQNTALMKPVLDMWLNSDKNWSEVVNHKATKRAIEAEMVRINGEQIINRHYSFFRDVNRYNFAAYWQKLSIPVFMMHGSLDIQAIESKWAFDLVALSSNSNSKAMEIEGAEHAFMRYNSASDYMSARNNRQFNPAQPGNYFDKRIAQESLRWLAQVRKNANANANAQYSGVNHVKYSNGEKDKPFVGNGFLIEYKDKTYAVTVKHTLLEAKTKEMNSVSITGHIEDWRIYPNQSPEDFVKLGKLLNASKHEPLDINVLSKDWLIFEVEENNSNLQILTLRESPLKQGESLIAYGCSYADNLICKQNQYEGTFLTASDTNLRMAMPNVAMNKLRGLSGSPVLDQQQKLVGIVSNVLPKENGEGFDFAPASLNYLTSELDKLVEVN